MPTEDPPTPDEEAGTARVGPARARGRRAAAAVRGLAVDMSPLRASRDYRLLWFGELISETGRQITLVAVFIQLTDLTGSPAAVGLVGLVQLVPLIVSTLWSGPLVDRMDRRKLLVVAQLGFATATLVLLLGSLGRPPVGLVYGAAGLTALFSGLDSPTRSAMIPNLVGKERLPAAIALNQVMWNTTMIVGPAVAGIVIARLGLTWAYTIDLATFAATLGAAALMRPAPPRGEVGATRGLASIREGFAYLRGRRVLQSTFTIDIVAMVFGMPRALFAFLAVSQFRRGPEVVGALFSAIAVGALAGALTAGWVGRVRRQGLAVMWAVAVWGAAIAGFGLSGDRLWLALLLLAVAGGADVISAVFRSTILHLSVPDTLRGRLAGIHILVVTGGPRLGDLEAGIVAGLVSPTFSVVSGGVACIAGVGAIGLLVPQLRRWRAGEET